MEYAYLSNDNNIGVQFLINEVPEDISEATKISIEFFSKESDRIRGVDPVAEFNTTDNPTLFDLSGLIIGQVVFKPGPSDLGLNVGTYYTRWLIYDIMYADGFIWGNDLIKYIVSR